MKIVNFKNQVDKRAIFLLLGCYCNEPRLVCNKKYLTNVEDYPEVFHKTLFGAIVNIAKKCNVQKITSLEIENEVSQFDGALDVWNNNNGWDYINEAIEMTKDKIDNVSKYYDDVRKYSIIRNANENLKLDVSFLYDEDNENIMNSFVSLSATDVLNKINEKFNQFKTLWSNRFEDAYSFQLGDDVDTLLYDYKNKTNVWGYPFQSKYLTALTRGMRPEKYTIISSISGGCKSRQAMTNACNIACDKIYNWHTKEWIFTGVKQPVLFISTELTKAEIQSCILAHISGVPQNRIVKWDQITKEEERIINESAELMKKCLFYGEYLPDFDDNVVDEMVSRYVINHNISFCFFDYINDSPSLWAYTSSKMHTNKLQTHQILFNFSQTLKLIANKYGIYMASSTQLNDSYKENNNKDASALKGSKAIIEKADIGILALPVTPSDLDKIKELVVKDGKFGNRKPNMAYYIFKNRDGDRTRIIVWTYLNMGTMREIDCFVTNYKYELITDINPVDISFDNETVGNIDVGDEEELIENRVEFNPIELTNKLCK